MRSSSENNICKFHHQSSSEWSCEKCSTNFCANCVPYGHSPLWGNSGPRCVLCNSPLDFLGASSERPAFWTQLWHFFQYPLHTNSLLVIAFIAVLSFILPFFGFLSVGVTIFLFSVSVKYSFSILEARANNQVEPPPFLSLLEKDEDFLFLKLIAVMLLLFGSAYFISGDNESLFQVIVGVITFALPAITIILAIEKTVSAAVNPLNVTSFIFRIGWAYLLMWLCYQIVSSGPDFILPILYKVIPEFLVFPFFVIIGLYFWFAANCMLGYTVYQYQDVLGHVTVDDEHFEVEKEQFDRKKGLAESYILLRENNVESAKNTIRPLLDRYPDVQELHDFYHKVLLLQGDKGLIQKHADYYISILMKGGFEPQAANIFQDTLAKLPTYKLCDVELAFKMASILENRGKQLEAIKLLSNLHKVNPSSPTIAPAYLMLARLISEVQNNDAQALQVLEFILKKYPNSIVRKDVIVYQELLHKIRSGS